ncbi:hypothetical protein HWV62_34923 [Athelia sp. TMB]|nr:hypothetical protein HWV62_34923 [Athelia sp. TMB]
MSGFKPPTDSKTLVDAPSPATSAATPQPAATPAAGSSRGTKKKGTGKRFLSAYAQTWIGMTPIWLMGEAVLPGAKVGGTFKGGKNKLFAMASELREELMTSSEDVVVILDKHFHLGLGEKNTAAGTGDASGVTPPSKSDSLKNTGDALKNVWDEQSRRAAEVIRAAGQTAIVAVSTSLSGAQDQVKGSSPEIKKVISKHGRDVVILVDKALKNPVVITGVSRFARSRGIPYSEGLLRLASMGLSKILASMPEDVREEVEGEILQDAANARHHEVPGKRWKVEEMDAEELERNSTPEARDEATSAGKLGGNPKVEGDTLQQQKESNCVIC